MKKQISKNVIITLVIILVVVGGLGIYAYTKNNDTAEEANATITAPELGNGPQTYLVNLAPGTTVNYTLTFVFSQNNLSTSETVDYTATIIDVQWPMTTINYTVLKYNYTQPAPVATPNLAAPLSMLGQPELPLPLILPGAQTGVCVQLRLAGEKTYTIGGEKVEAYVYEFSYNTSSLVLEGAIAYAKGTGITIEFNTTLIDPALNVTVFQSQITRGFRIAGQISVTTPSDWMCKPPISSDLRFTIEGTYVVRGLDFEPVQTLKIREAIQDKAIVLVIAKDNQQLTAEFWKEFLKASIAFEGKADFYAIILGPLSNQEQIVFGNYLLDQAGAVEGNVLIAWEKGVAVGKVYSFGTYEDIVNLVQQVYPDS